MPHSPAACLVIFDCDGVLVDSERISIAVDVRAINALGWPVTEAEVIHRHLGRSVKDVLADIEGYLGHPIPEGWEAEWESEYRRAMDELLEPVPGIAAAIEQIASAGFRTCVGSSGSHAKMRRTLGKTGLWEFFEGRIYSASEVANGKPAPDLFLHAARNMGTPPSRCVVVEDSQYGVAAALAAGMSVIGFAGGITPTAHLTKAHAVLTDMTDLPAAVGSLVGLPGTPKWAAAAPATTAHVPREG